MGTERDIPDGSVEPWRIRFLHRSSLMVAALALIWGAIFLHQDVFDTNRPQLTLCVLALLPAAIPLLPYRIRSGTFITGFLVVTFTAAWTGGATPGSVCSGLLAVILAGLLLGVREAVAIWALSVVSFGLGLHLAASGNHLATFAALDPRVASNRFRLVSTYLIFSSVLALGVSIVINRLNSAVKDAEASARAANQLRVEAERAQLEREKALQHFIEAQKFEVMARLAGSVAHDVNNSLQVILAYAELSEHEDTPLAEVRENAREIHNMCRETSQVARQLLALGQRALLDQRAVDLGAEIVGMRRALEQGVPADVTLIIDCPGGMTASVDIVQIKQALLNLAINAGHSMPHGGELRICLTEEEDMRLRLAVSDTGNGMDANTLDNIFTPFFTTKGARGSGLGLPTVKAIIEQHHGEVKVESTLGKGTTFHLLLPREDRKSESTSKTRIKQRSLEGRVVLVVDDDPRVRQAIGQMLSLAQATVLVASSGEQAVTVAREAQRIDAVCTDAVMPGMPTQEMLESLHAITPESRVLVCSAYFEDELLQKGIETRRYAHLPKPFTGEQLVRKVTQLLESDFSSAKKA